MATVYQINKGINKPLEFRGLKAQYIGYLAAGLVALLILFAGMYVMGCSLWVCLLVTFALGYLLVTQVYRLSRTFGPIALGLASLAFFSHSTTSSSRFCFVATSASASSAPTLFGSCFRISS